MATEIDEFPKASTVTIRKVGGGFILSYEVPAPVVNFQAYAMTGDGANIAMRTVEHVVPDQTSLGAALARLLRE